MTGLADNIQAGDLPALWVDCYDDLKVLARSRLRTVGTNTLIDTTALVHDSYLKLLQGGRSQLDATHRRQFFGYASSVMRSVIIDLAREKLSDRRGNGEVLRLDTQALEQAQAPAVDDDPLFVGDALDALRVREPRLAQVVEMRFFGGFTEAEIADALGISERTVRNDWDKARALMRLLLE